MSPCQGRHQSLLSYLSVEFSLFSFFYFFFLFLGVFPLLLRLLLLLVALKMLRASFASRQLTFMSCHWPPTPLRHWHTLHTHTQTHTRTQTLWQVLQPGCKLVAPHLSGLSQVPAYLSHLTATPAILPLATPPPRPPSPGWSAIAIDCATRRNSYSSRDLIVYF